MRLLVPTGNLMLLAVYQVPGIEKCYIIMVHKLLKNGKNYFWKMFGYIMIAREPLILGYYNIYYYLPWRKSISAQAKTDAINKIMSAFFRK